MKTLTVLVTGAGSLLGQGILRSLRMMDRPSRIITADPDPRAPGHWIGDAAYLVPMACDPGFTARIEEICAGEGVDFLFIGTDVELPTLSRERNRFQRNCSTTVIVSPPETVAIAEDKWLTVEFLQRHGFPCARSALATDLEAVMALADAVGLPLIAKPRRGARSVGLRLIKDLESLKALCCSHSDLIVQEWLPDVDGEFTAGCLVSGGTCRSIVVLRRDLRDGNTIRAYSEAGSNRFAVFLKSVSEALSVDGPCNFQFRVRNGEPVIFEINARFSGTTPLRAIFGFNEVAALIDFYLDGTPIPTATLKHGAVFKAWSDIFVDSLQLEVLRRDLYLERPRCQPQPFCGVNADSQETATEDRLHLSQRAPEITNWTVPS